MNLFDILGPVMVGPSSSHTAGAVRIGYVARKLLGEEPRKAEIFLHGSFATTGAGHGTDKALIAGLLGMQPDDMRIAHSFELAEQQGLEFSFGSVILRDVHPNTAVLRLSGESGRGLEIIASSLGGGRIKVVEIDGIQSGFTAEAPTLIVHNLDQPGLVAEVTALLFQQSINIATMQLYRNQRGGTAVMIIETDQPISQAAVAAFDDIQGIVKVNYLD